METEVSVLSWVEILLIVIGLSLNVFLISEYEGTMLKLVNIKKLSAVCGIFMLWQILSMTAGHMISMIPFFSRSSSIELKEMCYVLAAILFFIVAAYMLYKAWKKEDIQERLSELQYKRIFMEAAVVAFFTFLVGIGCGFLKSAVWLVCLVTVIATILAVIAGIYTGLHQGCKFRTGFYGIGGALFLIMSIDIIIRYL